MNVNTKKAFMCLFSKGIVSLNFNTEASLNSISSRCYLKPIENIKSSVGINKAKRLELIEKN